MKRPIRVLAGALGTAVALGVPAAAQAGSSVAVRVTATVRLDPAAPTASVQACASGKVILQDQTVADEAHCVAVP